MGNEQKTLRNKGGYSPFCSLKCKFLMIIISLLLILSLFMPIWSYYITAPQYPEGLQLHIFSNTLKGDLDKINTLNHYIGMKHIYPDSFIEFKIIPLIIVLFSITSLISAIISRRIIVYLWFAIFVIMCIIGILDFYHWLYYYAHNLDPNAPIKIETDYTPPLIGVKKLLNFTIYAYPNIGGLAIILSALLGFIAIIKR